MVSSTQSQSPDDYDPNNPELIDHERAYKSFNIVLRWSMLLLATALVTLTLWFAVDAGFVRAAIAGLIVYVLGYVFLVRHEEKQPLDLWVEGR